MMIHFADEDLIHGLENKISWNTIRCSTSANREVRLAHATGILEGYNRYADSDGMYTRARVADFYRYLGPPGEEIPSFWRPEPRFAVDESHSKEKMIAAAMAAWEPYQQEELAAA